MTSSRLRSAGLTLTALTLLALAGCESYSPYLKTGKADRPDWSVQVVETTETLEVLPQAGVRGLPGYERLQVEGFVADYKARGRRHGPLILALPVNGPGMDTARFTADAVREAAAAYGVFDVSLSEYDSAGSPDAPLVLAYATFEAVAPDCPSLATVNLAAMYTNDPHPAFGCATASNLAAMVADPADLLGTRRFDPADTARRAVVLQKYRAGQPTATERTDDERSGISDAVE